MRRALLSLMLLALASCSDGAKPDAQPLARTEPVGASTDDVGGLIRLESLEATLSWSSANESQLVAYATPYSEGIAWVMPGLCCPSRTFATATKVEIRVPFPESATLAEALAAHNRRVANTPDHGGECLASPKA